MEFLALFQLAELIHYVIYRNKKKFFVNDKNVRVNLLIKMGFEKVKLALKIIHVTIKFL